MSLLGHSTSSMFLMRSVLPEELLSLCSQYCSLIQSPPNSCYLYSNLLAVLFSPTKLKCPCRGKISCWGNVSTFHVPRGRKQAGWPCLSARLSEPSEQVGINLWSGCLLQTPLRHTVSAERGRGRMLQVERRLNSPLGFLSQCTATLNQQAVPTCPPHLSASVWAEHVII